MSHTPSGPTATHFSVVVLVITTLILTAVAFLFYREVQEASVRTTVAVAAREKFERQVRDLDDQVGLLKEVLGYQYSQVGQIDDEDPTTVIGAAGSDIRKAIGSSRPGVSPTVRDALRSLVAERDNLSQERDALVTSKSTLIANYRALERVWKALLEPERTARLAAERNLRTNIGEREEVLQSKDREIVVLRDSISDQRKSISELREALEKQDKVMVQKTALHRSTVRRLNRMVQKRDAHRFEQADGKVTLVESGQRLVWIDRGSADGLRPGIRFSVFDRDVERLGASRKGLKGVVEVSRVTGLHRSQARIIDSDKLDPFLPGDVLFSPIWSPGQVEHFALVGLVDLNNDGRSDIEGLRRYVQESGARIRAWVDGDGQRNGIAIDMSIKYLVVGGTPDPDSARTEKQRAVYSRLIGHLTAMREEAYDHGVRVIRLNDFLTYIGYRPGLGSGVSVTSEPAPETPSDASRRTSPLRRSPRTKGTSKGVSGRFRRARGVNPGKKEPGKKEPGKKEAGDVKDPPR